MIQDPIMSVKKYWLKGQVTRKGLTFVEFFVLKGSKGVESDKKGNGQKKALEDLFKKK